MEDTKKIIKNIILNPSFRNSFSKIELKAILEGTGTPAVWHIREWVEEGYKHGKADGVYMLDNALDTDAKALIDKSTAQAIFEELDTYWDSWGTPYQKKFNLSR